MSGDKCGVGSFCTTEKEKTAQENLTESRCKAANVGGLAGMSRRPTIGSSLFTKEDRISILMHYELENRQKKDGCYRSRTDRCQRLKQWSRGWLWGVTWFWLILLKISGEGERMLLFLALRSGQKETFVIILKLTLTLQSTVLTKTEIAVTQKSVIVSNTVPASFIFPIPLVRLYSCHMLADLRNTSLTATNLKESKRQWNLTNITLHLVLRLTPNERKPNIWKLFTLIFLLLPRRHQNLICEFQIKLSGMFWEGIHDSRPSKVSTGSCSGIYIDAADCKRNKQWF